MRAALDDPRVLAHDLAPGEARDSLERGVHVQDPGLRVGDDHRLLRLLDGARQTLRLDLEPLLVGTLPTGVERPAHRRSETRHPVLEDVVVCPGTERIDRGLLADGARHEDERKVCGPRANRRERLQATERGEAPVGENEIGRRAECGDQGLPRLHALHDGVKVRALQLQHHELGVGRAILNDDQADRARIATVRPQRMRLHYPIPQAALRGARPHAPAAVAVGRLCVIGAKAPRLAVTAGARGTLKSAARTARWTAGVRGS